MKITEFEIFGLFSSQSIIKSPLNTDLNILTGKNGAGKTSILKVLWYVLSGNIQLAMAECPFKRIYIKTDIYEITIINVGRNTCKIELVADGKQYVMEDVFDHDNESYESAEDQANEFLIPKGSSLFFPTFRRIEGGFTLSSRRSRSNSLAALSGMKNDVEESLFSLSTKLSNGAHRFVSAISTGDIVQLLLRQHAEMSEESSVLQQNTSQEIIQTIKDYKLDNSSYSPNTIHAEEILDGIKLSIENMEANREKIMMPLEEIRLRVSKLFQHAGITISNRLSFGEAANAINSEALSAGEKQMLSFICYNAFYKNSVIFIDEPELSLHADWQRQLFPILLRQQSSNQFIIATHSPFIYAKFPDKEIVINPNRGDMATDDEEELL